MLKQLLQSATQTINSLEGQIQEFILRKLNNYVVNHFSTFEPITKIKTRQIQVVDIHYKCNPEDELRIREKIYELEGELIDRFPEITWDFRTTPCQDQ